ncbi:MAG: peptidylprolyl isomerase [Pseudomonadota bacterium]
MKIASNRVVTIHYTLTNDAGETLDSSSGGDPLNYLHGNNGLIPGLERELEGREPGESFETSVQPEDGYGAPNPQLVQEVPLEALSQIANLEVGMQLQSQAPSGEVQVLRVDAVGEATATLNANHPLAGQVLNFAVSVEAVRDATAEELELGHAR